MKRVDVEIVFGILGSGKTSFINGYIEERTEGDIDGSGYGVVSFEKGKTPLSDGIKSIRISPKELESADERIRDFIDENRIKKLIIEWNGMKSPLELFEILDGIKGIFVTGAKTLIDADRFEMFRRNYRELIDEPIMESDLVLMNEDNHEIEKEIAGINERASIYSTEEFLDSSMRMSGAVKERPGAMLIKPFIVLIMLFFGYNILLKSGVLKPEDIEKIKGVLVVSLGIVLEAVPFIILGIAFSGIMQQFLTEERLQKLIPKNRVLGVIAALFLGFAFPVCDCAAVPVASRMIKKKVPLYIALIFMLSSPVINPTVLFATYYAFKDIFPDIIYLRFGLGIAVSVIAAAIISLIFRNKRIFREEHDIISDGDMGSQCSCGFCIGYQKKTGIQPFLRHIADEFISVGKYLILGSLIAAVFQVMLPIELVYGFSQNEVGSIIAMIVFSYLISLCSTSDSFVAKSFFMRMTTISVIGFLISGAMIDIKNTMVLGGIFRKKFTIALVLSVMLVSFILLIIVSRLFTFY